MLPPRGQSGFTLLELLVAMAIFGLVSTMAYSGLQTVLETRERVQAEGERLGELQLALGVLGRDLQQHIDRPWRDQWGTVRRPLLYDRLAMEPRLEFIRAGGRTGEQRSELRRVGYALEDGVFYRLMWSHIDGSPEEPAGRSRLAGDPDDQRRHIAELEYRFHFRDPRDGSRQHTDGWPPDSPGAAGAELLALEIILTPARGGPIRRLFPVNPATPLDPS